MKVVPVLSLLFFILLLVCCLAPWFGTDTSDARSERARPNGGWFPPLLRR